MTGGWLKAPEVCWQPENTREVYQSTKQSQGEIINQVSLITKERVPQLKGNKEPLGRKVEVQRKRKRTKSKIETRSSIVVVVFCYAVVALLVI